MAKVKGPLFSLEARGKLGDALVYFPWKGVDSVRTFVIPANPQTAPQQTQRGYLSDAVDGWHANAYTAADVTAWNRLAGILAGAMSGFNAMVRLAIAQLAVPFAWHVISDIQVDTPTAVGFDVDVENSVAGYTLFANIGTRKTNLATEVALVDDADGTYSLTWAGGTTDTDYYVQVTETQGAVKRQVSGIYHVKTS